MKSNHCQYEAGKIGLKVDYGQTFFLSRETPLAELLQSLDQPTPKTLGK